MMLQIMAYAVGIAALSCVAGLCLERLARLHGLSRRPAWIAAMLLSVLFPLLMILGSRRPAIPAIPAMAAPVTGWLAPDLVRSPAPDPVELQMPASAPVPTMARASTQQESTWKIRAPSDQQLIAAWLATSSVLGLYLCGAGFMLRRRAAGWCRATLLEQEVLVSEVTGPALIGVLRPWIVVPRWLLEQPAATQALILEHEQQHLQARDPLLMMAGLCVIAAMPWNLPLWWQWRRMRQAIEMDCDARVLRAGAEASTYAQVLLAVTRRARRMPIGALAMSEPANVLERRIENLVPDAFRYKKVQTMMLLALVAAGATAAAAVEAPRLPVPAAGAVLIAPQYSGGAMPPLATAIAAAAAATTPATSSTPVGAKARPASQSQSAFVPTAFTVRLLPLNATDPGVVDKPLLEKLHVALAAKLRTLPGLILLAPAADDQAPVNYEIEMKPVVTRGMQWVNYRVRTLSKAAPSILELQRAASSPAQPPDRPMSVVAAAPAAESGDRGAAGVDNTVINLRGLGPDSGPRTLTMIDGRTVVTPSNQADVVDLNIIPSNLLQRMDVVTGFTERLDPAEDQEKFVERLRVINFPADPSLKANLLDRRVEFSVRRKSLEMLLAAAPSSFDPEVLRGGIDLAVAATDPLRRSMVWKLLAGTRSTGLVRPLVQALGAEKNDQVRLDLVGILSSNFNANPEARTALESVARKDQQQIARMAAQRALTGDGGWNEYLVATLKNTKLTDAQRLAPLAYAESVRYGSARPALDDEAIRILANQIAKAKTYTSGVRGAAFALVSSGSPAALDVIIDILQPRDSRSPAGRAVRDAILYAEGIRPGMDPRVHAVFEQVAARDPDPAVRGTAQASLDSDARMKTREANANRGQ